MSIFKVFIVVFLPLILSSCFDGGYWNPDNSKVRTSYEPFESEFDKNRTKEEIEKIDKNIESIPDIEESLQIVENENNDILDRSSAANKILKAHKNKRENERFSIDSPKYAIESAERRYNISSKTDSDLQRFNSVKNRYEAYLNATKGLTSAHAVVVATVKEGILASKLLKNENPQDRLELLKKAKIDSVKNVSYLKKAAENLDLEYDFKSLDDEIKKAKEEGVEFIRLIAKAQKDIEEADESNIDTRAKNFAQLIDIKDIENKYKFEAKKAVDFTEIKNKISAIKEAIENTKDKSSLNLDEATLKGLFSEKVVNILTALKNSNEDEFEAKKLNAILEINILEMFTYLNEDYIEELAFNNILKKIKVTLSDLSFNTIIQKLADAPPDLNTKKKALKRKFINTGTELDFLEYSDYPLAIKEFLDDTNNPDCIEAGKKMIEAHSATKQALTTMINTEIKSLEEGDITTWTPKGMDKAVNVDELKKSVSEAVGLLIGSPLQELDALLSKKPLDEQAIKKFWIDEWDTNSDAGNLGFNEFSGAIDITSEGKVEKLFVNVANKLTSFNLSILNKELADKLGFFSSTMERLIANNPQGAVLKTKLKKVYDFRYKQ